MCILPGHTNKTIFRAYRLSPAIRPIENWGSPLSILYIYNNGGRIFSYMDSHHGNGRYYRFRGWLTRICSYFHFPTITMGPGGFWAFVVTLVKLPESKAFSGKAVSPWLRCHLKARRTNLSKCLIFWGSNRSISGRKVGRKHDDSIFGRSGGHKNCNNFFPHIQIQFWAFIKLNVPLTHNWDHFHGLSIFPGDTTLWKLSHATLHFIYIQ